MDCIRITSYDSIKTCIMSETRLRSDFDACVTPYKDFIKQKDARSNTRYRESSIATVQSNSNRTVEPDMSVEDCYYNRN
jgi:hypothetical protein